jgi:uncharacterized protein YecE (DUF72 family)
MDKTVYLGTSAWMFDDWKGAFYPSTPTDELAFYARRFNSVEIDSTFYRIPAVRAVESWRRRVPDGFRFAAKVPREITHDGGLVGVDETLFGFLRAMELLDEKLGPILFQFPPSWTPQSGANALRSFLKILPRDFQFAMEFRNLGWFRDEYSHWLEDAGVAWALTDPDRFPLKIYSTAPFCYVRWLGNRYDQTLEPFNSIKKNRDADEARWAEVLGEMNVREIWGYFNNHWAGFSPESARLFRERLGIAAPEIIEAPPQQGSLF